MSDADLMGKEIYELIYKHYDSEGNLIKDFEDVLYCEDECIPLDRVKKLIALLKPASNAKETLVSLEAAKLLAAWGVPEATDYFEYCIDSRIDKLGNLSPHRLHGYDAVYEEIEDAVMSYYARHADRSDEEGNKAAIRIQPILKNIIRLSKELPYNMQGLIEKVKHRNWRAYEPELKECFVELMNKKPENRNAYWNIQDLEDLLLKWDADFVNKVKRQH